MEWTSLCSSFAAVVVEYPAAMICATRIVLVSTMFSARDFPIKSSLVIESSSARSEVQQLITMSIMWSNSVSLLFIRLFFLIQHFEDKGINKWAPWQGMPIQCANMKIKCSKSGYKKESVPLNDLGAEMINFPSYSTTYSKLQKVYYLY